METDRYYLQYELADGTMVALTFQNINDLDGCHISLDMYKANLGPIDRGVLERVASKFRAEIL